MYSQTIAVVKCLRDQLLQYKSLRPSLSWRAIAKKSGVNRYFIKKIVEGELEDAAKSINFSQALLLLKFLHGTQTLKSTLEASDQVLRETFENVFEGIYKHKSSSDKELDQMPLDFEMFCIIALTYDERPITKDLILQILGSRGIAKLEKLVTMGKLVKLSCGGYTKSADKFHCINPEHSHLLMQSLIQRFFNPQNMLDNDLNYRVLSISRLNEAGIAKLKSLHVQYHKSINELVEDRDNCGDIPVFTIACYDKMI